MAPKGAKDNHATAHTVRVLDGLPRVRAVRKSYKIVEERMASRMIV
jgi:hypothetical protein